MFMEIQSSVLWKTITKIEKGWSPDEKYFIETVDGDRLLLRISDISKQEEKKREYEIICKYSQLGFDMSMPVEYGVCDNGKSSYMLLTWVEGEDLGSALPLLSLPLP